MPRKAIYPGTFDPITFGHLDVIERGSKLFDELIVAVAANPHKETFFSAKERVELIEETVKGLGSIKVKSFSGLLVDFAKKENCGLILRGLREMSDFSAEFQQAIVNRKLSPGLETVFVMANEDHFYISSSVVKKIVSLGGNGSGFVPKPVEKMLKTKIGQ